MDLTALLMTAFIAGLLGSGHCFGMCGGIAAAFGAAGSGATAAGQLNRALQFNLGRLVSYAVLGAILALLAAATGELFDVRRWSMWLRLMTALLIFLIGCQYLFRIPVLAWIERGGSLIWQRLIRPLLPGPASRGRAPVVMGLFWGFIPCGLVYTLLLTAASTGKAWAGALVMLAFGLGTLPALTGMTLAAPGLLGLLRSTQTRRWIGAALIIFAVWTAFYALLHGGVIGAAQHQHH